MLQDYAPPLHRHRTGPLRRSPRALLLGLMAALLGIVALGPVASGQAPPATVVVHAGDSLWSIAAAGDSGGDVRARVDEIIAVNHLSSAAIQPGQTLTIPPA